MKVSRIKNKYIAYLALVSVFAGTVAWGSPLSISRWQQSRLNWQRDFARWQALATSTDDVVRIEALVKAQISASELIVSYFQIWRDELLPLSGEGETSSLAKTVTSEHEWWQNSLRQLTLLDLATANQDINLSQQLTDRWKTTKIKSDQVSRRIVLLRFKMMYRQLQKLGNELKQAESALTYPVGWRPFSEIASQWQQVMEQIRLSLQLAEQQWQALAASNQADDSQRLLYTLQQIQQSMVSAQELLLNLQQLK